MAELYSNITKPVLDMLVYVRRLSDKVSVVGFSPGMLFDYHKLSTKKDAAVSLALSHYLIISVHPSWTYANIFGVRAQYTGTISVTISVCSGSGVDSDPA